MPPRDTYDEPTTGSGDPTHGQPPGPVEPVTTGSGDPQHKRDVDVENGDGGST
jgi:hypothetical protein